MTAQTIYFEPALTQRLGIFDTPCAGQVRVEYQPTTTPTPWAPVQARIHVDFGLIPLRPTGIRMEVQGRGIAINGYYDNTLKAGSLTVYGMLGTRPAPIWLCFEPDPEFWPEGIPPESNPIDFRIYLSDELLLSIPLKLTMEDSEFVISLKSIS